MKKVGEEGRHHQQTEEFREIRKEETREKNIQKVKDGSHPWLKGNRSEEHRKKLSDAKKGNQNAAGNVHSEETKRIISERTSAAVKGKPKKRGICSGCGKETSLANLTLYHVKSCGHIKDSVQWCSLQIVPLYHKRWLVYKNAKKSLTLLITQGAENH